MPILYNNRPLYRIKFKDADIKEVRKGNELEWGLYKIEYINGTSREVEGNISEYVWGYPNLEKEDFQLILPEGVDEYNMPTADGGFMAWDMKNIMGNNFAYRSKALGWYNNAECKDEASDPYLSYIPAVTRNFHTDLLLFCKWRQRQYRYSGTLCIDRYTYI